MKKYIILVVLSLIVVVWSCKEKSVRQFDEAKMLNKMIETLIVPESKQFYADALLLQKFVNEFVATTNGEALDSSRSAWEKVAKDWARCYAFNIGEVKKGNFFRYLSTFPVNGSSLDEKIENTPIEQLTAKYVLDRFGLNIKGIYGVEYLLYKEGKEQTIETYNNSEKRKKVLQLIVNELVVDIENHTKAWDKYAPTFLANQDKEAFSLLFGGIDNVIHYGWETKIGKAIRKNDIEAPYSQKSLEILQENIAQTKKIYFEGGFADKVAFVMNGYQGVNEAVEKRYAKIETLLQSISSPLKEAVANSDKEILNNLLEELEALENIEFAKVETTLNLIDGTKEGDGD